MTIDDWVLTGIQLAPIRYHTIPMSAVTDNILLCRLRDIR